jgi:hypothetical protein
MGEVMGDIDGDSSGCRLSLAPATTVKGAVDVVVAGGDAPSVGFEVACAVLGGVVSISSSGIVGQYVLRTCLSAGRRMGFERKKSMPESRHSCNVLACAFRMQLANTYLNVALL